jgi:hypothetical protein
MMEVGPASETSCITYVHKEEYVSVHSLIWRQRCTYFDQILHGDTGPLETALEAFVLMYSHAYEWL